jgi:hypothetical protein
MQRPKSETFFEAWVEKRLEIQVGFSYGHICCQSPLKLWVWEREEPHILPARSFMFLFWHLSILQWLGLFKRLLSSRQCSSPLRFNRQLDSIMAFMGLHQKFFSNLWQYWHLSHIILSCEGSCPFVGYSTNMLSSIYWILAATT